MDLEKTLLLEKDKNQRIGIIGGGPSGLAAAWFLMKSGYKNVIVIEKEERVGGKCETVVFTDKNGVANNYECGAEYITFAYDTLFDIMDEVGEEWVEAGPIVTIMGEEKFANPISLQPLFTIIPALVRYMYKLVRYRKVVSNPSNRGLASCPELSQSSIDFIKQNRLEALKGIFVIRQFGYGTFKDFPAIHLLRTVPLPTLLRIIVEQMALPTYVRNIVERIPFLKRVYKRPVAALAKSGTQGLFEKLAARLNEKKDNFLPGQKAVLRGQEVRSIKRAGDNGPLVIQTSKDSHEVDKVICAVTPNVLVGMMDMSENEKELLQKIKFHSYWVGFLETDKNLARNYYQNLIMRKYEPVQFSKRWDNSSIIAYGYNWLDAPDAERPFKQSVVEAVLKQYLVDNMGITEYFHITKHRFWPTYHPHVSLKDFQDGYFDKVEALQGKNGVYFTGDAMSCESMEYSCKYSKELVERFF